MFRANILRKSMISEFAIRPASHSDVDRDRRLRSMVDDHFDAVWRALKRLGVPEAGVDDAAQQLFLVAARKLDIIESGHERRYLLGIAVRIASDVRRSLRRRREVPLDEAAARIPCTPASLPDEILHEKRAREVLATMLDSMPSDLREAFVLFELEQFTSTEVAELIGVPIGTVASRVRRAREHIRRRLAVYGGEG